MVDLNAVEFLGIASAVSQDVCDFYATEQEAQAVLERMLEDAPELKGVVWVERVELRQLSQN